MNLSILLPAIRITVVEIYDLYVVTTSALQKYMSCVKPDT